MPPLLYKRLRALSASEECQSRAPFPFGIQPGEARRPVACRARSGRAGGQRVLERPCQRARKHMTRSPRGGMRPAAISRQKRLLLGPRHLSKACKRQIFKNKITAKNNPIQLFHDPAPRTRTGVSCSRCATVCRRAPGRRCGRHTRQSSPVARGRECRRRRKCSHRPLRDKQPARSGGTHA